jgi:acylglycerol lipase
MGDPKHGEGRVDSKDGTRLYWQRWMPEEPKAIVLIVHGLFDHSGRFAHVAEWLCGRGYGCYGLDYRCHGRSPGLRVHVDRYDEFLEDVDAMRALIGTEHAELPRLLLGHSNGGLLTILSVLGSPDGLVGAVVTSPFLGVHPESRPPAILVKLLPLLVKLVPKLRVEGGVDPKHISRDRAVVDAYVADPLVTSKVSTRVGVEVMAAQERAHAEAGRLRLPMLLMFGGDDHVVDIELTRRWARAAPKEHLEVVEWDGLYHEILNEPEKDQVLERIGRWLDERLAAR